MSGIDNNGPLALLGTNQLLKGEGNLGQQKASCHVSTMCKHSLLIMNRVPCKGKIVGGSRGPFLLRGTIIY
ncbi:unnamed protein product [Prunus armeniaca]|uniref:Uncharacterized protein n=1 Tax=Prunus armeniaca TaxID=36596 RepID=A0A6J5X4E7_PRUAR|nr:unnamed protein product [Prunus armeniaca]